MTLSFGSVGMPSNPSAGNAAKRQNPVHMQQSASSVTFASHDRFATNGAHSVSQAGGPKSLGKILRFGSNHNTHNKPFLRSTLATTLGVVSGIGLMVGIPLGLLQMAIGIIPTPFTHPFLYTGLLTMGLPALGLTLAWLLAPRNKGNSSHQQSTYSTPEEMV